MLVAVITTDKPGALDIRLENRPAHVEYLKASSEVQMAGPFVNEAGEMCGSMIILEVETLADAQAWAQNDPYEKAGLFADVRIQHWNKVIG
ncbi:YciI family protein [Aestuariibius sp. HNIBRBA575]|uniref:YciI family protein n=1 Tax=Aestuariibius sp. HNIBRBA575 TaxID=3233343 RepID=UPI0034A160A5